MKCPECGFDAGEAKFCPECGSDLRGLGDAPEEGVCPECGADTGDAKFCPECGHKLAAGPPAAADARTAPPPPAKERRGAPAGETASGKSRQQRRQAERRMAQRADRGRQAHAAPAATRRGASRNTVWLIWGGLAVAAVVVVLIVIGVGGGGGGTTEIPSGGGSVPAVTADTSGSYTELVNRANGLYDQGSAAFQKNDTAGAREYFAAAAKVYAAAWKKQPGDPSVGTDFATSLYYAGQTDKALAQVEKVLEAEPGFQTAYLNKGIFLKTAAQEATDSGDTATADQLLAKAKASFEKAVSIDAGSDPGKRAAEELQNL